MAKDNIIVTSASGGISKDKKSSQYQNAARFIKSLNIHSDYNESTLMPKLSKVSGLTVTALVKWSDDGSPFDTNRYFYDEDGNLYKETSGGTWSVDRASTDIGNGAAGQGLAVFDDFLYYATSTTLGRKGKLSGTPSFDDDFLSDGTTNIDQSGGTTGSEYTTPTSIAETSANKILFTPTRDPLKEININVDTVGTGNWTVTVHDANDNELGSKTIANASLSTGETTFTFSSPLRVIIGNQYHIHITSSVGDGKVETGNASSLAESATGADDGAFFETIFGILVADTDWHPMFHHLNFLAICNERYLAVWDQALYNPNQLVFAAGFKAKSISLVNEYLVIDCWRGDNTLTNVEAVRRYFWDGIEPTFNFYLDIPLGFPNAIGNSKNRLISILGNKGLLALGGDSTNQQFSKIQEIPKITRDGKIEVYPGAITEWQGKTYIGVAASASSDSTGVELGVYEFGNRHDALPEVLTLAFVISEEVTSGTNLKIGMVKAMGEDLYVSWRNDSVYGVDKVSPDSDPQTSGSWESLVVDNNNPMKTKEAEKIVVTFEPLESGESVTPKYRKDRAASFTSGTAVSTIGETRAELVIPVGDSRYREFEFGFDVATSTSFPVITSVGFFFDTLAEEATNES